MPVQSGPADRPGVAARHHDRRPRPEPWPRAGPLRSGAGAPDPAGAEILVAVVNFTPVARYGYRLGVPAPGAYSIRQSGTTSATRPIPATRSRKSSEAAAFPAHLELLRIAIALFIGLVSGVVASAQWETVLLWLNKVPFGTADAEFGTDWWFKLWGPDYLSEEGMAEREQQILTMRFYGNLTQSQIAEQVGISQMHVSRLLTKALTKLRAELHGSL